MTDPGYEPRMRADWISLAAEKLDELLVLKQQPIDAVPTPLSKWNSHCRDFGGGVGLARGWHVTIAGNTGHGKSLLALCCSHTAITHGEKVGFVSLEMSWEQLATRFMAIVSGERVRNLEPGSYLDPIIHKRAARAIDRIKEKFGGELWCNERHISSLEDVTDAIDFLNEVRGCRYIVVDYMQLVSTIGARDPLDTVTRVSHLIRDIGADLKVVTIGLSQFNRETSKDYENSPTPQGLMGGSPLENDSNQVILIDHSSYEKHPAVNTAKQKVILGKNRHGGTCSIECEWNYDSLRIAEVDDRGEAWEEPEAAA